MRPFLIDTDTASDDAVALIMALAAPDVRVVAITTVAGNVGVEQATRNALCTLEICGADTPVYQGAAAPLAREHKHAHWFHGVDGLSDRGYPAPRGRAQAQHAVDAIIETAHNNPGLTLVTLGPLTNIALALARDPSFAQNIARCVVMGGAPCCEGNVTPAAEYNIWVDPEAARAVLRSALPVELVGWHLCRGAAVFGDADSAQALALGTAKARFAIDCNSRARAAYKTQTGENGIALPDPAAMAIALDRTVGTDWSAHWVEVETQSSLTRGMTVVDRLNVAADASNRETWAQALAGRKTDVCWTLDAARFKAMVLAALT